MPITFLDAYNSAARRNPTIRDGTFETNIGEAAAVAADQEGLNHEDLSEFIAIPELHEVVDRMAQSVMSDELKGLLHQLDCSSDYPDLAEIIEATVVAHVIAALKVGVITGNSYARLKTAEMNALIQGDPPSPDDA